MLRKVAHERSCLVEVERRKPTDLGKKLPHRRPEGVDGRRSEGGGLEGNQAKALVQRGKQDKLGATIERGPLRLGDVSCVKDAISKLRGRAEHRLLGSDRGPETGVPAGEHESPVPVLAFDSHRASRREKRRFLCQYVFPRTRRYGRPWSGSATASSSLDCER